VRLDEVVAVLQPRVRINHPQCAPGISIENVEVSILVGFHHEADFIARIENPPGINPLRASLRIPGIERVTQAEWLQAGGIGWALFR